MSVINARHAYSPEFELVSLAASTDPEQESRERIESLFSAGVDWTSILRIATSHQVVPLLYQTLASFGDGYVPKEADAYLRQLLRRFAVQNLVVAKEIGRVLPILSQVGVPAIPFKGVILAAMAYRNLGLRPSTDVDLLLPRWKFVTAKRALVADGYSLAGHVGRLAGVRQSLYLRLSRQCPFVRPDKIVLDVHLGIMPPGYRFAPSFRELQNRSVEVRVGDTSCRTFSPEDTLLILCLHGVKNRWQALKHYCDVAELIRATPNLDWDMAQRTARESASERILLLGLVLASRAVHAPVPSDLLRLAESDKVICVVSRLLLDRLPTAPSSGLVGNERFRFHMQVQNRVMTKLRYLVYAAARRAQERLAPA